jgi:4-carboxymuconolactone decarboxylase
MTSLDRPTQVLVRLASAIATGRRELVEERCRAARTEDVPAVWVDELLLQSVLMVGYPLSLTAAAIWREVADGPAVSLEDGTGHGSQAEWQARGEAACRIIYGGNYAKLRENVRRLHPALDAWMVVEGYGRTLSRPGLDLGRRELCVVAQVAVLGAERQLHSHLKGTLHAGVDPSAIDAMLDLILPDAGAPAARMARDLWRKLRP